MKQLEVRQEVPSRSDPQASIPTFGEVFPDGTFIELVRTVDSVRTDLLLWDGREQTVGEVVEHCGLRYKPRVLPGTILRELKLPAKAEPFGSVRELLAEICKLIDQFVRLPEKSTALVGRFILATWLVDAMQTAPRLLIEGPDISRARQLARLLHSTCRRAVPMSAVTPGALCSLPSGVGLTLLVHHSSISPKLATVLQAATVRGNLILRGGELRDLYGAQVILHGSGFEESEAISSIRVPCIPIGQQLPALNLDQQQRIVEELQPRLLTFRFFNYHGARSATVDKSKFAMPLQELVQTLAAATPQDGELQGELHTLLREENVEIEAAIWVDPNTVIVEAILAHCREAKLASVYVGAIAKMAEKILEGRGESCKLDPGETGRRIKNLGFSTEPRDAKGVKLLLSNAVCVRAHELAHELNVPAARECDCKAVGSVGCVGQID